MPLSVFAPPASSVRRRCPGARRRWRSPAAAQPGGKPPAQPEGLGVSIEGRSKPTLCAEDDNVYLTFTNPRVRHFRIEARPPAVIGSIVVDSTAPDFTDCTIEDQPAGPEDKHDRVVLHEDDDDDAGRLPPLGVLAQGRRAADASATARSARCTSCSSS